MSCLCDRTIEELCTNLNKGMITPFDAELLQPASYELTLDCTLMYKADPLRYGFVYDVRSRTFRDSDARLPSGQLMTGSMSEVGVENLWTGIEPTDDELTIELEPNVLYIAGSKEMLRLPADVMGRFEGKSTLGRVGLMVHITAGYVDPGFEGNLTLEFMNVAPWPIVVRDGDKIGQMSFHSMNSSPERLYGAEGSNNHYQRQNGPTLAR